MFIKPVKLNRPLQPKLHFIIDENILCTIVSTSSHLQQPHTFIALYLLAFFSFLRLSNILPHSVASFDKSRHLCILDVIFGRDSALLVIKWSKTLQDRTTIASVSLPVLGSSPLCSVAALLRMLHGRQHRKDEPLFQDKFQRGIPLTVSVAKKHLKAVSLRLKLPKMLIFHDFRRRGATGPLEEVYQSKTFRHKVWSLDCVWRCIYIRPSASSAVSSAFQMHLPT